MGQRDIEIILTRQWASYLAVPVFLVDPAGNLIFYNEPAEALLGRRFEETGEMPASEWSEAFKPSDEDRALLPPDAQPLMVALLEGRPAHRTLWIHGLDDVWRHIEATALPIIGQANRILGAMALFWEAQP